MDVFDSPELAPLSQLPLGPRDQARAKAAGRALLVPVEAALRERELLSGGDAPPLWAGEASWVLFTQLASLMLQIEIRKASRPVLSEKLTDGSVTFGLALLAALGPMALTAASRKRAREDGTRCPETPSWKRSSTDELLAGHSRRSFPAELSPLSPQPDFSR